MIKTVDRFYRFKKLYEEGGELALRNIVRLNRPNPKDRVDPDIESRIVKITLDNPALGQQRVSNELRKSDCSEYFLCRNMKGIGEICRRL